MLGVAGLVGAVAALLLLPRRAEVAVEEAGELGVLEVDVDEAGTGGARSPRICTPRRASGSGVCGGATGSTDPWSAELADGGLGVEGAGVG